MLDHNKFYLPYLLNAIKKKLSALFFQKLVLYDSDIQEQRHLRHYDLECEGLLSVIKFCQRKIIKNQILAFQKLKSAHSNQFGEQEFIKNYDLKSINPKTATKKIENFTTPKSKRLSRINTTFQQSDNSIIFSPNTNNNAKLTNQSKFSAVKFNFLSQKNDILQRLLKKVKKFNAQNIYKPQKIIKRSDLNLNLSKESFGTLQKKCNCDCHTKGCHKQLTILKNKYILQNFDLYQNGIITKSTPFQNKYNPYFRYSHQAENIVSNKQFPKQKSNPYEQTIKQITYTKPIKYNTFNKIRSKY